MKLKNLTMLTLGASTLIGSVSANAADPVTSTSTWNATATVETSAKLSIVQSKQNLAFVYNSATDAFTSDNDTLTAILRSDTDAIVAKTTTGMVIKAALTGNTLSNAGNYLNVLASFGQTPITSTGVKIFDSSIKEGNAAFDSFNGIDNYLTAGGTASSIVNFDIDYYQGYKTADTDKKNKIALKEGKYKGQVQIEFTANWTHEA